MKKSASERFDTSLCLGTTKRGRGNIGTNSSRTGQQVTDAGRFQQRHIRQRVRRSGCGGNRESGAIMRASGRLGRVNVTESSGSPDGMIAAQQPVVARAVANQIRGGQSARQVA